MPFDAEQHYKNQLPSLERLATEVQFALAHALSSSGIKLHGVTVRVKDQTSYLEKIARKNYNDPQSEVQDLVGARIVCLYASDLPKLGEVVESLFEVIEHEDKVNSGPSEAFGYMSVHYVCRLPATSAGPRYEGLHGLAFEIQCRTILMDAWANVSHHLAYKGEASIPRALKRDFHALAALFHIADSHFEILAERSRRADEEAAILITETSSSASLWIDMPIDRSTVQAYLVLKMRERQAIRPVEEWAVSDLVEEISELGVETVEQLDDLLTPVLALAYEYESEYPPGQSEDDGLYLFSPIGLARTGLAIASARYASDKYPEEDGVFQDYRSRVPLN